ncbi:MAG: L-histidine N(alpha)-methyltransferase [Acidobacteria bacterium]|nr:L-histidine N(alpha)-methyltransferase [Acidobacteriota bacterium]
MPKTTTARSRFAEDVAYYLSQTPRQLPSEHLYDELGSELFEAICRLPWYGITRAEQRLLERRAGDIVSRVAPLATIVELGPGSGLKLATLLAARPAGPVTVHLVDVSAAALDAAGRALASDPDLAIVPHEATYEAGLAEVAAGRRSSGKTLTLFLGSNIGNFDPPGAAAFLRNLRTAISEGDSLLLGADLVKPESELLLAYNDPLGVTAAFNKNLLVRANTELDADFDLAGFSHRAIWNDEASRIEMHLVSTRRQRVRVPAVDLNVTFEDGDTIWTESSYKYRTDQIVTMLSQAGFSSTSQWSDDGFALTLAAAR